MKTSGSPSTAQSRFLQLLGLPRALLLFFGALALSSGAFAASFAKGDLVEVTREAPLYFKEATLVRTAQKGERFTVLAARPDTHRVFVSAKDAFGQEIALNVSDDALILVKNLGPAGPVISGEATRLPGAMAGRAGDAARKAGRVKNAGTDASEKTVIAGLRWLVKTQRPDGSWSEQHKAAMTGFALLSFLGHGETNTSAEFGKTVQAGIDWVMDKGKAQNGVLTDHGRIDQPGSYTHGIVTYALGEYYTMTRDEPAGELFKQAIKLIVDGQGPDGGWMYGYDKSQSDTSVGGWQIQALKIAHLSGLNIDGVDAAMDKAMLNLKRVQTANGGFGYRTAEDRYGLTGVGVLGNYCWHQAKNERVTNGLKFIMSQLEANPVEYKHATADLYAWYYNTQAILMVSGANGPEWKKWNAMCQEQLIVNQKPDGSWPVMTHAGHGSLQNSVAGAGPYYRTCLSILMLEVYYRYAFSPTARRPEP
jgi:hypothetical protein